MTKLLPPKPQAALLHRSSLVRRLLVYSPLASLRV